MKKCLECGSNMITKIITTTIKGVEVKDIEAHCCDKCGAIEYPSKSAKTIEAEVSRKLGKINKTVD